MAEAPRTVAEGTKRVKKGLPAMLKGGVIMDVMNKDRVRRSKGVQMKAGRVWVWVGSDGHFWW